MPFVKHRGQRIHYTVDGDGPLIVLQHGLLMSGQSWKRGGIVDALADRYRVACVDSLGHGESDKPYEPALYHQNQRAGDIVAVLDDLGCERAHLVGHSMGAWLAVGVAKYYPERLSSLVLGGWDFVNGLPPTSRGPLTFDAFMKFAGRVAPELVQWVTPACEPGVRACFEALGQLDGARQAVVGAGAPVLIWEGRDDPAHDQRKTLAEAAGLAFLSTAGDHLGMLLVHGAEAAKNIRAFAARYSP
ncbi:Alpha/beta hydrolase fold [Bradyrhizobium sp. STM 3843]|uniref:alpha/beta fold hydrolase n=1 Tax=Bradyrhizobium sp. STM 3843 TaxID=551947 RepID=UPI00024046B7|nr:alpha/beta hydrolase [Bradyrhizobium sp. STM 3843]CCE09847.1 Alpha/beta hydrolase fold [Bradyrhizobium sp. STM 3843]